MKFRLEKTYSTERYFVEYKHWIWGWEAYDRLRFKNYEDAIKHLEVCKKNAS